MAQEYSDSFIQALLGVNQGPAPQFYTAPGTGMNLNDYVGILQNFRTQPTVVEDDDYENIEEFVEEPDYRNIFQKGMDFYRDSPGTRIGIGALLGGPVGALTSFFAPQVFDSVSEGIGSLFGNRMDMKAFNEGMQSAMDDTDPADQGVSSFDAAVAAGIEAAEDDA